MTKRRQTRTLLLVVAVPLAVTALVFGVRLTTLAPITAGAREDYDAGRFEAAAEKYEGLENVNVVQPWKAHFDAGTARAADVAAGGSSSPYDAVDTLHEAYRLAEGETPEVRCLIQTNLALAYELMGDDESARAAEHAAELAALEEALAAREAGEPYDEEAIDPYGDSGDELDPDELRDEVQTWYEYAEGSYRHAENVQAWPDCGQADRSSSEEQSAEEAEQRVAGKADAAEQSQPDHEEPAPSPEPTAPDQAEAERQQQLEESNQQAAETADQEQQEDRDTWGSGDEGDDGGGGPTKNW
ncbi:hypothetical protein L1785_04765 [Antribacter sp. KLBMP9083]|uniref:MNN4 protein n=1 Tax=Antribacter soli TaxID=2910976 RepID=A0AA41U6C0_9MICO|nr:hypothetical protein [Antribacter soli]MCF4120286.1 hypothetical protein [Antribacter soli]